MANTKKTETATEKKAKTVAETVKTTETEKQMFDAEQVQEMIQKAVAEALVKQQPQTISVQEKEEDIILLYMGTVVPGSTVLLGTEQNRGLGEIQGNGGIKTVSRKAFFENLSSPVLKRLKDRRLVVLSGLTDEERERYGLQYTDGELLSQDIYQKLFTYDENKIVSIFDAACFRHKQIIVTLFMNEYTKGNPHINQPLVERLNEVSKKTDKDGMFRQILKDIYHDLQSQADEAEDKDE